MPPPNDILGACPDDAALAALLRADPSDPAPAGLLDHVDHCPRCSEKLEQLSAGGAWLSPLKASEPSEPPSPALLDAMRRLAETRIELPLQPSPQPSLQFLTPTSLPGYAGAFGPYNVISVVGRGGMGIVLKAHDPSLDRVVALKVMSPELAANPESRKRFVREARAAAAVSHEHVVTIHAVDEANGLPYLVMQFVGGRSLEKRIRDTGALKLEEVLRIGMQIASGLAAAHAQGVVHRDIKPANIMLENGVERVKITDFGLAYVAHDAAVTLTGQVSGTPSYMAPEQARDERVDARADLFSLGCVLYAMCTGKAPFAAATPLAILRKVCEEAPAPIQELNPAIPAWLVDYVARLMQKDASKRPKTAQEVADVLGSNLAELQGSGPLSKQLPKPRRRRVAALVGAVCIAVITLAAFEITGVTRWTRPADDDITQAPASAPASPDAPPDGQTDDPPGAEVTAATRFAVLGADGVAPRGFDSLAEAVSAASRGDTIEIRTNDIITTPRIDLADKPLVIRAADGFTPVIAQASQNHSILTTGAPLVLEGLFFRGSATSDGDEGLARVADLTEGLVVAGPAPAFISNCRFEVRAPHQTAHFAALRLRGAGPHELRNSAVCVFGAQAVHWRSEGGGAAGGDAAATVRIRNSVFATPVAVSLGKSDDRPATLDVSACTVFSGIFVGLMPGGDLKDLACAVDRSVIQVNWFVRDAINSPGQGRKSQVRWTVKQCLIDLDRARGGQTPANNNAGADEQEDDPRPIAGDAILANVRLAGNYGVMFANAILPATDDFAVVGARHRDGTFFRRPLIANLGPRLSIVGTGPAYASFRSSTDYVAWRRSATEAFK